MGMLVRDLPEDDRPREKLLAYGTAVLNNTELLAILLRTGTASRSALQLAEDILAKYKDKGLEAVINMSPAELMQVKGVAAAKAATIIAAVELGRRISMRAARKYTVVSSPDDAAALVMPVLREEVREHFMLLILDTKNHVIAMPVISIGTLSGSLVHPREVFREAVRNSASSIILVHNHPSGDPTPSKEDCLVTARLVEAGKMMDIPVCDHIIIGDDKFVSLKEEGMIE